MNHIDTAASYGESELQARSLACASTATRFFLATKTGEREYAAAREQIRHSLERLGVDQVDLIQLHCLVHPDEWDVALGEHGALRAAIEARDEGLVRFIGVTGHGLTVAAMHLRSLERVRVRLGAAALQPRDHAGPPVRAPTSSACSRPAASAASRCRRSRASRAGRGGRRRHSATTWYEPLVEQPDIDLAVHWVLGEPGVFLNSAGDLALLPRVLDAAERFEERPDEADMARLLSEGRLSSLFA